MMELKSSSGRWQTPIRSRPPDDQLYTPKITNDGDQDPRTVTGLVYRLTGDPLRVLVLIGLLAALAGILVLALSVIISLSVPTPIIGAASVASGIGVMLIGFILRRVVRSWRR